MVTKQNSKLREHPALDIVKKIGFIFLIVLIFSPLSFLVSNTITENLFVKSEAEDCWSKYKNTYIDGEATEAQKTEQIKIDEERNACEERNEILREEKSTSNFIIISVINIIVIVTLLFALDKIDSIISYSMFFSAGINSMIIIISNIERINSLLGVSLGIVLFILTMLYINKNLKRSGHQA